MIKMKIAKKTIGAFLLAFAIVTPRSFAQDDDIRKVFSDFAARAADGKPRDVADADPALQRLSQLDRQGITEVLPVILQETSNRQLSVRRLAASALYQITTRPDGQGLLSTETPAFAALLVDPDIPIRRITGLAIANLRPDANSQLVPVLESYLARQDAVTTIGPGVATILMKVAPDDVNSTDSVVDFMRRPDQTSTSRSILLTAIKNVAKSHNREIGKEVAAYADDPDEQTSSLAIATLQSMGKDVVLDNRQSLSRIAADNSRPPTVRDAAKRAISAAQ